MRSGLWIVALVAACYSPTPPTAAPCGPGGACPTGQQCDLVTSRCGVPGANDAGIDAAADAATDAPVQPVIDASVIDAPPDAPNFSGCSDGEREAFLQVDTYPTIAGCAAQWQGLQSLRSPSTGIPCGDDVGPCVTPNDACAPGWHACGEDGSTEELRQIEGQECATAAGEGRFLAAMSHCSESVACQYTNPRPCTLEGYCSEPVCCGPGCAIPGCLNAVWPGETHHSAEDMVGCGGFASSDDIGILCCQDP